MGIRPDVLASTHWGAWPRYFRQKESSKVIMGGTTLEMMVRSIRPISTPPPENNPRISTFSSSSVVLRSVRIRQSSTSRSPS